jgi:hypothetical protein
MRVRSGAGLSKSTLNRKTSKMKKINKRVLAWELAAEGFATLDELKDTFDILEYISPYDFYPDQLTRFPVLDPLFGDEDDGSWYPEPISEFNSDDLFEAGPWPEESDYEYFGAWDL